MVLLSEDVALDLVDVLQDAAVYLEHGGPCWVPSGVEEVLAAAASCHNGILTLVDDEAEYGEFDGLERFLTMNNIAFDRQSEAKYEYDAELIQFRPGMERPHRWLTTQNGEIMIPRAPVKKFIKGGVAAGRLSISFGDWQAFRASIGPDIPKLTPLKIVKGDA